MFSVTAGELRQFLSEVEITQAEFARLIAVTSRAVSLWLSGERPIPGPVEAYLRLLGKAPPSLSQTEFNLLKQKGAAMRDGMFGIKFQGNESSGVGLLIFDNGRVYGTDEAGVRYDGGYVLNEKTGLADVSIRVTFPKNVRSVFGISNPYEWTIDVTTSLNTGQDSGALSVKTSLGNMIHAQYFFLRSLPDAA